MYTSKPLHQDKMKTIVHDCSAENYGITTQKQRLAGLLSRALPRLGHQTSLDIVESLFRYGADYDDCMFWRKVRNSTVDDWMQAGVPESKIPALTAVLEIAKEISASRLLGTTLVDDPSVAARVLGKEMLNQQYEKCGLVCLDIKHRVMKIQVLTEGTLAETLMSPRMIFGEALKVGAARIVVAHNHPSGDLTPSDPDLDITRQLLEGAKQLGLPLLDHLIFGANDYASLRQTTDLWSEYQF